MSGRGNWAPLVVLTLWVSRSVLSIAGLDVEAEALEFPISLAIGWAAGPKAFDLCRRAAQRRYIRRRWATELAGLGVKPRHVKSAVVHHTITMPAIRWDDSTEPHDPEPVDHHRCVFFELKDGRTVSAELEARP